MKQFHLIQAITPVEIRREIELLSLDEVISLSEKIVNQIQLTKEHLANTTKESWAEGGFVASDKLRGTHAALRIMGLQATVLNERRGELRRQRAKEDLRAHDEKQCWAHHFFKVAKQSLSFDVFLDIVKETDQRQGIVRKPGFWSRSCDVFRGEGSSS